MADQYVVLVTGSRTWTDAHTMHDVMAAIVAEHGPGRVTFRHGRCRKGADMMCDRIARQLGAHVEQRPADWDVCAGPDCTPAHRKPRRDGATYCPGAGIHRDAAMVDEGAHESLAFIDPCADRRCRKREPHGSHGATETARMAEEAGIPVRRFPEPRQVIDCFTGQWADLSSFGPSTVTMYSQLENRTITFPSGEHGFNWAKSLIEAERAAVLAAPTPAEAKRIGRRVTLRPGWDEVIRYKVMRAIIAAKFTRDSPAGRVLLDTGDALLVEGNTWHDNHWGDCRCGRTACWRPGENWLGRMLMDRRVELRRGGQRE
ncbi:NADAR domain-containing protein [Nonomuraea angiospora]|uniref:NADAR domain-containing protein n=1 Tax=Nonomuraea angiospora TaxID=46172 RepID=UPI00344B69EC